MQYALYQPTQVMEVSGSGAVTALEPGWNYVIASSKNTMFDSNMCLITVVDTLPAQSVSVSLAAGSAGILSENVLTIEAGSTAQLEAAVEPYNSTSTLSWSGGNDCASVDDNGKITAIKKGSARVTASAGEKSAAITVRVLERHAAVESTCTENGTIEYWEDADGNLYDSNEGITPVDDISLPLAAHTLSKVSGALAVNVAGVHRIQHIFFKKDRRRAGTLISAKKAPALQIRNST